MKKLINLTNLFFVLFIAIELIPSRKETAESLYTIVLVLIVQMLYCAKQIFGKNKEKNQAHGDITVVVYVAVIAWEILSAKLNILNKHLYPAPGEVIKLFIAELPDMLIGFISSMQLLLSGYILALITAIPLALLVGWRKRLFNAVKPLTKVLGPIPPIVYIPYAIAILPTFKASSIFIIFIGAFWPIFINTLNGVFSVEKKIVDSAKALNVSERAMLLEVILPGALPSILSGATIGLVLSFILLTSAEMIGATKGMGWYVKFFSDFADYTRVLAGIIFIGIVVTLVTWFFDKAERYLLRWRK